ncbi:MAG: extracellular solute-binding protein, partial [bacterium]|nr:extracellular solute-binding protein [bacterium]
GGGGGGGGTADELSVLWFAWPPCDALASLVADYPDAEITVNCVDISIWHDTAFTDFAAQSGNDIVIADSQWVGEAVVGGHFLNLTDFVNTRIDKTAYVPAALAAYGEFPLGSADYWGVAIEGDTQMLVYRKDVFDAAGVQPPTSWSELRTQAQDFAAGDDIPFGYATHFCGTAACYDQIQTAWNQIAWSFGGSLWDSETATVEGVLNSSENVAALELFTDLFETAPEGAANYTFNEVVSSLCNGQVAMGNIWFGFAGAFLDPAGCAESANLAYAVLPGETEHVLSLGGMGMSISSYSENQTAALD